MVLIKHYFLMILVGLSGSGFAGGMIFSFYRIPVDSIILIGSIVGLVSMGMTIFALSKIKGIWTFEVFED